MFLKYRRMPPYDITPQSRLPVSNCTPREKAVSQHTKQNKKHLQPRIYSTQTSSPTENVKPENSDAKYLHGTYLGGSGQEKENKDEIASPGAQTRSQAGVERCIGLQRGAHGRPKVENAFQVISVVTVVEIQAGVGTGERLHDFDHVGVQGGVQNLFDNKGASRYRLKGVACGGGEGGGRSLLTLCASADRSKSSR